MSKTRVLAIADDREVLRELSKLLERNGCDLTIAATGARGVQSAIAEQPDLIVVDTHLARGSGRMAVSFLKRSFRTSHIPLITFEGREKGLSVITRQFSASIPA